MKPQPTRKKRPCGCFSPHLQHVNGKCPATPARDEAKELTCNGCGQKPTTLGHAAVCDIPRQPTRAELMNGLTWQQAKMVEIKLALFPELAELVRQIASNRITTHEMNKAKDLLQRCQPTGGNRE